MFAYFSRVFFCFIFTYNSRAVAAFWTIVSNIHLRRRTYIPETARVGSLCCIERRRPNNR